jgi:translation elongation factor aEF-1 beta
MLANAVSWGLEVLDMGQVAVTIKVYPEDPKKLEDVKKAVAGIVKVVRVGEEPIGFGLVAAVITFVMEDSGGLDAIEEKIGALPDVSQVQVVDMDRL